MGYTTTLTAISFFIEDPITGTWEAEVENVSGSEGYRLKVLGKNQEPVVHIEQPADGSQTQLAAESTHTVKWSVADTDPVAISLCFDDDNTSHDGTLVVAGLTEKQGSYQWDTSEVPSGAYYIYLMVDDLKNPPVVTYSPYTVTVENTQPPSPPTGLEIAPTKDWKGFDVSWHANPEMDVVGYSVYYGSEAGTYEDAVDVTNVRHCFIPVYRYGEYYVAVSARDVDGNQSCTSEEVTVRVGCIVHLPIVFRTR